MPAILFDLDDTLYDQAIPFCAAYENVFLRGWEVPVEQLFAASRHYGDQVFEKARTEEMSMEEMYRYRIQKAFEDFQIQITDDEAMEFQRSYAENQYKIQLTEHMRAILDLCREKAAVLGVITNGPSVHQRLKAEALGINRWIAAENILISGDLGYAKPDIRIFLWAEKQMGLIKGDTYYVGDSFDNDIAGASKAGWNTIWMNRRKRENKNQMIKPDICVSDEKELYEVMEQVLDP